MQHDLLSKEPCRFDPGRRIILFSRPSNISVVHG
jgi:hypothetical protein